MVVLAISMICLLVGAQVAMTATSIGDMIVSPDTANPDRLTINITLSSFDIPSSERSLIDSAQSGKIDTTSIAAYYTGKPVAGATVSVTFASAGGRAENVCDIITGADGKGSCSGAVTGREGDIIASFGGSGSLLSTKRSSYRYSGSSPGFGELVDASWLILFFFLGLLAAGVYSSGRRPTNAFDITTPKFKGPKGPPKFMIKEMESKKFLPSVVVGVAAVGGFGKYTSSAIRRMSMDYETSRLLNVVSKYGGPEADFGVKAASRVSNADKRAIMIGKLIHELGVHRNLRSKLSVAKKQLSKLSIQKDVMERKLAEETRKVRLAPATMKPPAAITSSDKRLGAINAIITSYTKKVEEYEDDLKLVVADRIMEMTHINALSPVSYREMSRDVDRAMFIEYVELSDDKRSELKDSFKDTAERIRLYTERRIAGESTSLSKDLEKIFRVKAELERMYAVEIIHALNTIRAAKDTLPESSVKIVFDPYVVSEKERIDEVSVLFKQLNAAEGKEFETSIHQLFKVKDEFSKAETRFLTALEEFNRSGSLSQSIRNELSYNTITAFSLLKNRAEGYLYDIERGGQPYYHVRPKISNDNAKVLVETKLISMNQDDSFEVLFGKFLRPSTGREEQEFLKDNLHALEEKNRTVFETAIEEFAERDMDSGQFETIKDRLRFYEGGGLRDKLAAKYKEMRSKPETEETKRAIRRLELFIVEVFPPGTA